MSEPKTPVEILAAARQDAQREWDEAERSLAALLAAIEAHDIPAIERQAELLADLEIGLTGDACAVTEAVRLATLRIADDRLGEWASREYGV